MSALGAELLASRAARLASVVCAAAERRAALAAALSEIPSAQAHTGDVQLLHLWSSTT
jgi:hypothetical protein